MNRTLIVIILDESSSMNENLQLVMCGYNSFIKDQRFIEEDIARVFQIKFSSKINEIIGSIDIREMPNISPRNYQPDGMTALFDAVAKGIHYATIAKAPDERVVFLIITDGEDNMSKKATANDIKEMIHEKKKEKDWTFLYIGENPQNWAKKSGMDVTDGLQYNHRNPEKSFFQASQVLANFRKANETKGNNLFEKFY